MSNSILEKIKTLGDFRLKVYFKKNLNNELTKSFNKGKNSNIDEINSLTKKVDAINELLLVEKARVTEVSHDNFILTDNVTSLKNDLKKSNSKLEESNEKIKILKELNQKSLLDIESRNETINSYKKELKEIKETIENNKKKNSEKCRKDLTTVTSDFLKKIDKKDKIIEDLKKELEKLTPNNISKPKTKISNKLTCEQVNEIRNAKGTNRELAAKYNINHSTVSRIKSGKLYKDCD